MKNLFVTLLLIGFPALARCQGQFSYSNISAPTRIGTADGPLAGAGIWGQMLVGLASNSLVPVGSPMEHLGGRIFQGSTTLPWVPGDSDAFVQMVAWDGTQWGTSLNGVPNDQIGRSDIVLHFFTQDPQPFFAPRFNTPAIVPIPEPSNWILATVGFSILWLFSRPRRIERPQRPNIL